jgi:hypothetical protein
MTRHAFQPRLREPPPDQGTCGLALFEPGQRHSNAAKRKLDRYRVLMWFVAFQRGTPDECSAGLEMDRLCTRPRITELTDDGCLVERKDLPRKPTGKGGTAGVWEITAAGEAEYRTSKGAA